MFKLSGHQFLYKWTAALLVFAFALGAFGVQSARAASITVTTLADSGSGSLRQAIIDLQPGGTITFDSSLAGQTVTITSGWLAINKNLKITGLGANQLAISGGGANTVFFVNAGVTATMEALTIRNGYYSGLLNDRGTVTLNNISFNSNSAAAIDNRGTLNLNNSTFTNNGTGILNLGTVTVDQSTFNNNSAGINNGGAIYSTNTGVLTISNSTFSANSAISGGAIYSLGTLTIINSTFISNSANGAGGALYIDSTANVTVTTSNFNSNSASDGAGINNHSTLNVDNSTFQNNVGTNGGGILNVGTLTVSSSTFDSNSATNGGGIANGAGQLTAINSTFSGNSASYGGAIYGSGTVTITNSTLSGNSANPTLGGGILNNRTLTLKNTIVIKGASGENCSNYGTLIDGGGNLSWLDTTCPGINSDPKLASLANNGGSTQTMALQTGSAAIDAGLNANCASTDQRGKARPQGSACDIGAFELEQASPTATPTDTAAPTDTSTPTATPTNTATNTPTDTPTATNIPTDTPTPTDIPTNTPTATQTPANTPVPPTPTPTATQTASATPTWTPTSTPTIFLDNFSGFFQPVDNLPMLNTVRGGASVPVNFSLNGDQGANILAAGYPVSQQIACVGGAPVDAIEQTATAGGSSLSYDPATDTYTYVWKTESSWRNTCRQLIVRLIDGTEHAANFKFK